MRPPNTTPFLFTTVAGSFTAILNTFVINVLAFNVGAAEEPVAVENGAVKYLLPQACSGKHCCISLSLPEPPPHGTCSPFVLLLPAKTAIGKHWPEALAIDFTVVPVN